MFRFGCLRSCSARFHRSMASIVACPWLGRSPEPAIPRPLFRNPHRLTTLVGIRRREARGVPQGIQGTSCKRTMIRIMNKLREGCYRCQQIEMNALMLGTCHVTLFKITRLLLRYIPISVALDGAESIPHSFISQYLQYNNGNIMHSTWHDNTCMSKQIPLHLLALGRYFRYR